MSGPPNPLLNPPFFTIPGINPASPITAQMEQIDQLNTLLLQEIDANFARFHQVITTRILPEIKRFAIAGEPTREAAQFWRKFFETAAATPIPGAGGSAGHGEGEDDSRLFSHNQNSTSAPTEYEDHTMTLRRGDDDESFLDSRTREEGSFMFDPAPGTSSTPLPSRLGGVGSSQSWEDSMESPFDRVDRQLRDGLRLDAGDGSSDIPTPSLPSGYTLPPLGDAYSFDASSGTVDVADLPVMRHAEPSRPVEDAATPRPARSYLPAVSSPLALASPARTQRLIDITQTPLNAKISKTTSGLRETHNFALDRDIYDDDDEIEFPMSPPVTMNFTLPPKASAILAVAKTPLKHAPPRSHALTAGSSAANADTNEIGDLLDEITRGYEPSPRLPTPPGLGRYSMMPGELAAALGSGRRLFAEHDGASTSDSGAISSTVEPAGRPRAPRPSRRSVANTSFGSDIQTSADDGPGRLITDDEDSFDADDTFSSAGGATIHGNSGQSVDSGLSLGSGSGFGQHQGFQIVDESYISDADDTYYPPDREYADDTDTNAHAATSSSRGEASLIFGKPPSAASVSAAPPAQFALMQQDEMVTYHGGKLEDARLPHSPTRPR